MVSRTDRVRNEKCSIESRRSVLHTIKMWKANWFGLILCRNCLLEHVMEGDVEGRI